MRKSSPTVAQLELNRRLRDRRNELGLTTSSVAKSLGFSPNYWSAIENDRTVLSVDKLESVVSLFDFDRSIASELHELHRMSKEPRWWMKYASLLDDDLIQFFGLEAGAIAVQNYEGLLVNGLLQTREYAEAVISADATTSSATLKQRWELRSKRQNRLRGEDPIRLTALMSEAALMQHFGDSSGSPASTGIHRGLRK